jgi:hypothetical protein
LSKSSRRAIPTKTVSSKLKILHDRWCAKLESMQPTMSHRMAMVDAHIQSPVVGRQSRDLSAVAASSEGGRRAARAMFSIPTKKKQR